MNVIEKSCAPSDQVYNWNSIDWDRCESEVRKLQVRLVKAQKENRPGKVKALQWLLTHSFCAKALAVKRVTSNKGKNTAGVDNKLWSTPNAKFQAIADLKRRGYKPQPLKRVNIEKSNGKLRPLGIPTMKDRTMQALYLMALEPVAETIADNHSYGFRKERSTSDARERCFSLLSKKLGPQWILEADIKGCFDHINHDWLLNHVPMDRDILQKWLKCGFIFKGERFQTEEGTPQGGIISPTLANIALDGLQRILAEKFRKRQVNLEMIVPRVHLVRYADDFIITGTSKEQLENEVMPLVKEFLAVRGLELSQDKTKITHITEGFDFLGFNVRKYDNGKLLIKPSKNSLHKLSEKVAGIINANKTARQEVLIRQLNPVITGWANYYKGCVASETFRKVDFLMFQKLWKWALRRHPKKGKYWIADRYFRKIKNRNWCFATDTPDYRGTSEVFSLKRAYDIKILRHVQIKQEANPFDQEWEPYFQKRKVFKMLDAMEGKKNLLALWLKQDRACALCGRDINADDEWATSKRRFGEDIQFTLVHKPCRRSHDQLKLRLS
ncbi:RNA-directed DNA polymerase [Arcticibacter tournemirensis]|uniref:Group II intron reverse transcriptase/maturase n=1 Tax=Arcticibacter tournemirensis TaxID=699437 RepID=A0A5M9GSJ6_9SPHI|nr:group II intron reverse transcriptase/maturase [Arcticibacter tournemirensis]KAA8476849.1 group II intron reverse transcriptase/maturase [Arcticibacter tournemirensis]TQM49579.1 RNA-directed DNA polymerase [Arcticibacter tournemirensis]